MNQSELSVLCLWFRPYDNTIRLNVKRLSNIVIDTFYVDVDVDVAAAAAAAVVVVVVEDDVIVTIIVLFC